MFRFSRLQLALLFLGFSLIALALTLDRIAGLWAQPPETRSFRWGYLTLEPDRDQHIEALDARTLVVRTDRFPLARLTLFTRPDDGATPRQLVRSLCSRDHCTYSALERPAGDEAAAANYRTGEPLRIVLMRPGGGNLWIEFKGPPDAYAAYAHLIDSVSHQLRSPKRQ